jgi:hypothetical protein
MKRMAFVGILVTSLALSGTSANAATKSDIVVKGFQSYVTNAKAALTTSKIKYGVSAAALNAIYENTVANAKSSYEKELLTAKNLYEPQIIASNQSIKDAQAKLLTVNQVKVVKLGTFRSYWGNLDCPVTRPQCVSLDDKGNLFQIGEITRLKAIMGERSDYLYEIQLMIDLGLIEMLNAVEYQKAATIIRTEPEKIKSLTSEWDASSAAAAAKQNTAIEFARMTVSGPLMTLKEDFDSKKSFYESQIAAGNSAIRAAKRASKNPTSFDKAFVTALKFEYNVKWLDDIANLSFSSLNTLRSYLSQFAIIKLADEAAGVDSSYNYQAAEKVNKSVGNVFTSDEEFQAPAKLITAHYRKLTKVSLKF